MEVAGKKSVYNENKESWRGLHFKSHELFHSDPFWSEREHLPQMKLIWNRSLVNRFCGGRKLFSVDMLKVIIVCRC